MNNRKFFFLAMIVILIASILVINGCKGEGNKQSSSTTMSAQKGNPHPSGAIDISKFPELKDKTLLDQAINNFISVKNFRLITHTTGIKDGKTIIDTDYEVKYVAPDQVYFFGDDTIAGKRMEIFQLGNVEYRSYDGVKWTKKSKKLPEFNFLPKVVKRMVTEGSNFRLVASDRAIENSKSATIIIFERSSTVYKGQKEQIVFYIDNASKTIIRIEILNDENKPTTFNEEFLRFQEFNSSELKLELPNEAKSLDASKN